MKYLKRFNEATYEELNENLAEEIQWIDDAVIDLSDMGYNISINPFEVKSIGRPGLTIRIGSTTDGKLLPISIGEYLLTIDSYLKERGFVGFRPYDYDNPYSPSRHDVKVNALLKGIKNMYENELSQFVNMLKRFQVNAPFDSVSVSYYKPEEVVKESSEVLTPQMVKDILLSVYEEEFDSYRFRFFNRPPKSEGYQTHNTFGIDFIPEDRKVYFNIEQDDVNKPGSIKISALTKTIFLGNDNILSGWDNEKLEEFESILSDYGYHLSSPPKHRPTDACYVLHPSGDGNRLVMNTMRESRYSIIPN